MSSAQAAKEIDLAAIRGHDEKMKELIQQYGSSAEYKLCFDEALCHAAYHSHEQVVAMLLALPTIDLKHASDVLFGYTALTRACISSRPEKVKIVKLLLTHPDCDLHHKSEHGITPLFAACYSGQVEILHLLLQDPRLDYEKAVLGKKMSPVFETVQKGHTTILKYLIAYASEGSRLELSTDDSKYSELWERLVEGQEHDDCVAILREFYHDPRSTIAKYRAELGL